jgi:hypothetical protein
MCECLQWHHPLWKLAARRAGARPLSVFGVVMALRNDRLLQGLTLKERVSVLADGAGEKPITIALIIASLQQVKIVDDAGNLTADENADEMTQTVTKHFVTRRRGRPPLGSRAMTGSERTARWKAHKSAELARDAGTPRPSVVADETADTSLPSAPSLSFFPDIQPHQEEQKQTRARADETADGFAQMRSLWPLSNRMADAEREYRRALRAATAPTLLELARHYLDTKPAWQNTMFLVNWLRTEPWRDPVLPLRVPLRAIEGQQPIAPRSPDWVARLTELKATGLWPDEWGPDWGMPGCQAPGLDSGCGQGFARYYANRPMTTKRSA